MNVHKYFALIDVIDFQIVQNLMMLFVLTMVDVCQVDVAIVYMTVYTVKMNTGVHQTILMSNLYIAFPNMAQTIVMQFSRNKHIRQSNSQQKLFQYYHSHCHQVS